MEKIGRALAELEARRRHFLLQPLDLPDLNEAPHLLAARAITGSGKTRPVKRLLKELNARLASEMGSTKATAVMAKLREDARHLLPKTSRDKNLHLGRLGLEARVGIGRLMPV